MNQVGMVFLLKIKRTDQFRKLHGFIFRFMNHRYHTLSSSRSKCHKEQNGNHCQIQSPAKRSLRNKIAERRHLYLCSFLQISLCAYYRKLSHLRQQTENISCILSVQYTIIGKKQRSRNQNNFPFSPRTRHGNRNIAKGIHLQ